MKKIEERILEVLIKFNKEIEIMSTALQTLQEQVAANNVLIESAVTLIQGLAAQILALKDNPAALQELAESLQAQDAILAAAIAANTPAEPPAA